MENKELIEYLQQFSDDTEVSITIFDPKKWVKYPFKGIFGITDMGYPAIFLEVEGTEPLDEEEPNDIPGQMCVSDFPEVLP